MKTKYNIEIYKTFWGQWRWRIKSNQNGKIVGASTESFKNRVDCAMNLELVGIAIQEYYKHDTE